MWEIIIAVIVILAVIVFWFINGYNGFITLKNSIEKAWSNIDVLLKQRFDEIPNLVETAKGYMKHEKGTFEEITKARTAFMGASTVDSKAKASSMLNKALMGFYAVAENYPKLKADKSFQHLQERISALESDIANKRESYNGVVNEFNIRVSQFPSMIIAGFMKLKNKDLFQVSESERQNVKIQF
ncbi:MAG: LemA family protein [Candidatus Nanoarchaeia archaeon]|nr:LemA family protein [Candidatus Nanoarchaeia archaeon]